MASARANAPRPTQAAKRTDSACQRRCCVSHPATAADASHRQHVAAACSAGLCAPVGAACDKSRPGNAAALSAISKLAQKV
ncbi:hypothetical protein D3C71_1569470 [compost metagenome]